MMAYIFDRSVSGLIIGALMLGFGTDILMAQEAVATQPAQPGFTAVLMQMLPMFAMVFLIFHFLVIRPQQQKAKAQDELIKSLKRGDTVTTSSGIIGKVSSLEDGVVHVEVSSGVKLRIESAHIAKKREAATTDKAAA